MADNDFPKKRKCPCCGEELRRFSIVGIYCPIEQIAIPIYQNAKDKKLAIKAFGNIGANEWFALAFSSTCNECGNITFWNIPQLEVSEIISLSETDPLSGWAISWNYSEKDLSEMINNTQDENTKLYLQNLINWLYDKGEV